MAEANVNAAGSTVFISIERDGLSSDQLILVDELLSTFKCEVVVKSKVIDVSALGSEMVSIKESLVKSNLTFIDKSSRNSKSKQRLILVNYFLPVSKEKNYEALRTTLIKKFKKCAPRAELSVTAIKIISVINNNVVLINYSKDIKAILKENKFKISYLKFIQFEKIITCTKCGQFGHDEDRCSKPRVCVKCWSTGHLTKDCRRKAKWSCIYCRSGGKPYDHKVGDLTCEYVVRSIIKENSKFVKSADNQDKN